jgi:competence protein ComEC
MGLVFGGTRRLLAFSEHACLYWPNKQIAAIIALLGGVAYLVLAGMQVPMMRSVAMAALFTLGVLAGRRGLSMRALGFAAVVLMIFEPQELTGVSLQMSFSAVLALVAGFEALRPSLRSLHRRKNWHWRSAHHVAGLALTSLLAGTASAPFGAYHFGRIQIYFILSNMLAVPLTSIWIMPLGLISLALLPFGLEWLALWPMGWGVDALLWMARQTAALPAATLNVPHIPLWGLLVMSFGIVWLGLWRSRLRLAAIPVLALGVLSPVFVRPPDILVSADARLIGMRTAEGVFVQQTPGADKFTLEAWEVFWASGKSAKLEAAGDAVSCTQGACLLRPQPRSAAALLVRGAEHPPWCADVAVMLSAEPARGLCPKPWPRLVDRFTVWRRGSQAIWLEPAGVRILSDQDERGARPWVPVPVPRNRQAEPPAAAKSKAARRTSPERDRASPESSAASAPSPDAADLAAEP